MVDLARRALESLGDDHELVDQLLHAREHLRLRREEDLRIVDVDRAGGQLLQRLVEDPRRLAHLLDPHEITVVDVPLGSDRHLEVVVLVAGIGALLAKVELDAGGAQIGAGHPVRDRIRRLDLAHSLRAPDPDHVLREQRFVLVHPARELVHEGAQVREPFRIGVVHDAADARERGRQARAREVLDEVVVPLAIAEGVEEDRGGADVERVRAEPEEVAADPRELAADHAKNLAARRNRDCRAAPRRRGRSPRSPPAG
jgi:hypothetical protein